MKFNDMVENLIINAISIAKEKEHDYVTPEHLLLAIVNNKEFQESFNKSEKKIPLFVSINDSYCIPLLSGSSDYYVHIINVDNTVAANVSKSGTLYYSEFKAVIAEAGYELV